jgi:hypothetical protein
LSADAPPSAVLDSCILYPAPLRDFFMRLAVTLYQPLWTDDIHEEWIRNVLEDRPDQSRDQLGRTRDLMDRYVGPCRVTGYEPLIETLTLPDSDDRHVLAAAIAANAPLIVTFNLKDFPSRILATHGIRAVHPDAFALSLFDADAETFIALVKKHRQALVNPAKSAPDYLATLDGCGLTKTAARLQAYIDEI